MPNYVALPYLLATQASFQLLFVASLLFDPKDTLSWIFQGVIAPDAIDGFLTAKFDLILNGTQGLWLLAAVNVAVVLYTFNAVTTMSDSVMQWAALLVMIVQVLTCAFQVSIALDHADHFDWYGLAPSHPGFVGVFFLLTYGTYLLERHSSPKAHDE